MPSLLSALNLPIPKSLAGGPAKVRNVAAPTAAAFDAPRLLARHQKIKGDLEALIKKGGPLAASLKRLVDEFKAAVAAKDAEGSAKVIGRLEELVWMDTGKVPDAAVPAETPAAGGAAPADPDDAALVEQMQIIDDYIGSIGDEKVKARLLAEFDVLWQSQKKVRGLADAKKRTAGLKGAMAPVKALLVKASQLAMKEQEKRFVVDAQKEVEAMLSQVTALVLGAIKTDGPRKAINAELAKLQGAADKAKKLSDPKTAMAGWNALKPAARALIGKAEAAAGAGNWADGQLRPLLDSAKTAIDAVAAAGPKAALAAEHAAIVAEIAKHQKADDLASLQKLAPRVQKLHRFVTALAAASATADAELARATTSIEAFDATRSVEIRAALKTLSEHKKTAWPAGSTPEEMDAAVATFAAAVRRLITDAEGLKIKLDGLKDLEALKKRLETLQPRIDKANEASAPAFLAKQQKDVAAKVAALAKHIAAEDLKPAESAFTALVKSLDTLDKSRAAWDAFKTQLAAAKAGEIKTALALKLLPAALAATRTKAINKGESDLMALASCGYPTNAAKQIAAWVVGAKAWAGAKEAYDLMRSDKPTAAGLEKLAKAPGGGPVLDALVADLPDDIPQEVLTEAVKARYGITVKQYDHQTDTKTGAVRTAANPKSPDKDLKGLYSVLGKVPLKDTAKVKSIDRYTEESGGAAYGNGEIDLYCGRPNDGNVQDFNKKGEVVPDGDKVDKNCEPINPKAKVGYFDFATLHEVGHAVDDKKGIMKGGRNADAGWEAPSRTDIAAVAAAHFSYDAAYIEAMIRSKTSAPPAVKPPAPTGVDAVAWDLAREKAEDWVKSIRVDAGLWWHAADCKRLSIGGRVYHEAYAGSWVSYKYSARAQGVTGYQFRSPMEWFAELYAAYFMQKMNPKHPAASWLAKLKAEAN